MLLLLNNNCCQPILNTPKLFTLCVFNTFILKGSFYCVFLILRYLCSFVVGRLAETKRSFSLVLFSYFSCFYRHSRAKRPLLECTFRLLGALGPPPAAWAPEGTSCTFHQQSRKKRLFSFLVASRALPGLGCRRAFSGSRSSFVCAGVVFADTHVAVWYTWLLLCLSWRPPYTVKTNTNSLFLFLRSCHHLVTCLLYTSDAADE